MRRGDPGRSLVETNRWEWSRRRKPVLRRDGGICRIGGPGCTRWAEEVDHIIPRIAGGTDAMDNLRSVCKTCHRKRMRDAIAGRPVDDEPAGRNPFGTSARTIYGRPSRARVW